MKFFKFFFALLMIVGATQIQAQSKLKIGHIDNERIAELYPAWDSVKVQLENLQNQYAKDYADLEAYTKAKQDEYYLKSQDPTTSKIVLSSIQDEFNRKYAELERFWQEKNPEIQKKAQALQQPILDKVQKAIEEVAKEHNYTYIVDKEMFYYSADTYDITDLVLVKLGVVIPEETE